MTRETSAGSGPRVSPRVVRAVGVATAAVLLTAGCAAGQSSQTAYQKSSIDGTNRSVGRIDLRGLAVEAPPSLATSYAAGSDAVVTVVLVNNARTADRLVGIKTAAAGGWAYFAKSDDAFAVQQASGAQATGSPVPAESSSVESSPAESSPAGSSPAGSSPAGSSPAGSSPAESSPAGSSEAPSDSTSPTPSGGDSTTSSGTPSATPSSSSVAPLPTGAQSVTIAAGERKSFGTPEATGALLLTGLTRQIFPGNTIQVTFTFAKAGAVTIFVPVQLATVARTAEIPGGEEESG